MKLIDEVQAVLDRSAERDSLEMSEATRRLCEADAILAMSDKEILAKAAGRES